MRRIRVQTTKHVLAGLAGIVVVGIAASTAPAQQSCRAVGQLMPVKDLPEASGIAVSRNTSGLLWSHNDSGEPVLIALGTDGTTRGRVSVAGAGVEDWEDIDVGPCPQGSCVYIGDIGDNNGKRGSVTIYRVPEPDPETATSSRAESMRLTYPDGPKDAESLIVMPNGTMYVVTKGERSPAALYRAGPFNGGGSARLELVATIVEGQGRGGASRENRITGAAVSRDGQWVVLRSLSTLGFYPASDLVSGKAREAFRYGVSSVGERQGEGVAFGDDGTVWLASEGGGNKSPGAVARLTCTLK